MDPILSSAIPTPKKEISLRNDIALDIKLEILAHINSVGDLRSLMFTCRAFYDISQTYFWEPIYTSVLENELGAVGRNLVKLRRFKASKTNQEMETALPTEADDKPKSIPGYLSELIQTRRTVRFYTCRLFEAMLFDQTDVLTAVTADGSRKFRTPTAASIRESEYLRVDQAYYIWWLWGELDRIAMVRTTKDSAILMEWALWNKDRSLKFPFDLGVLYTVYRVTNCRIIYPYVKRCAVRELSLMSLEEKRRLYNRSEGLCTFTRETVSTALLRKLGFDGLETLLKGPQGECLDTIRRFYRSPIEPTIGVDVYVGHAILWSETLTAWWEYTLKRNWEITRPLWKESGGIYKWNRAPWNQNDGFDILGVVWDDERLTSWGYKKPVGVDSADNTGVNVSEVDRIRPWQCDRVYCQIVSISPGVCAPRDIHPNVAL
ncbi:hypothetical protein DRE_04463 [Drechslerella stenobrocha 248]|uniref:F-box domain-containing protein n=1 Tax=Drechslerella stenobrocha 248 TaxID=1043628 RepID=W7I195_9PEZI|nr:hypothetical protein DRE_04463 [Drechslerella stenobrocha 248]